MCPEDAYFAAFRRPERGSRVRGGSQEELVSRDVAHTRDRSAVSLP